MAKFLRYAESPCSIFEIAAGTGMLGHGVKLVLETLGIRANVVGGCEREATAAFAFLESLEISQGGRVPVWDDANTFVDRRQRGLESVDVVTAGYPCQPFSAAGKRLGTKDDRHLWPAVRRIVARLKPRIVFFENVDGHVSKGLRKVLRDTKRLGYEVTCGVFSAEEVGASHLRKRVFILGKWMGNGRSCGRSDAERGQSNEQPTNRRENVGDSEYGDQASVRCESREGRRATRPNERCDSVANAPQWEQRERQRIETASGDRCESWLERHGEELAVSQSGGHRALREPPECDGQIERSSEQLGDSAGKGRERQRQSEPGSGRGRNQDTSNQLADDNLPRLESRRPSKRKPSGIGSTHSDSRELPLFPPHRDDYARWAFLAANDLDASHMPAIESGVSVVADGMASPADLLRLGGNGVVPLQAAWAFINLFACLMEGMEAEEPRQTTLFD